MTSLATRRKLGLCPVAFAAILGPGNKFNFKQKEIS